MHFCSPRAGPARPGLAWPGWPGWARLGQAGPACPSLNQPRHSPPGSAEPANIHARYAVARGGARLCNILEHTCMCPTGPGQKGAPGNYRSAFFPAKSSRPHMTAERRTLYVLVSKREWSSTKNTAFLCDQLSPSPADEGGSKRHPRERAKTGQVWNHFCSSSTICLECNATPRSRPAGAAASCTPRRGAFHEHSLFNWEHKAFLRDATWRLHIRNAQISQST
jgi:hypothetical protein